MDVTSFIIRPSRYFSGVYHSKLDSLCCFRCIVMFRLMRVILGKQKHVPVHFFFQQQMFCSFRSAYAAISYLKYFRAVQNYKKENKN